MPLAHPPPPLSPRPARADFATGNLLFRGNMPVVNGSFALAQLSALLKERAVQAGGAHRKRLHGRRPQHVSP